MNGLSLFLWMWIAVVAIAGWVAPSRDELGRGRFLAAFAAMFVVTSTRDMMWIYIGFEALSIATLGLSKRSIAGSLLSLLGMVLVVASARTTDLAALEPTTSVQVGVVSFLCGVLFRWLQSRAVDRFVFLGAGVAVVAVFVRLGAWSPDLAEALAPLGWFAAMVGMLAGSLGAALAATTRSLVVWITVACVALAVAAVAGGAPVLPHILMHTAASTAALALVLSGGTALGLWLPLLSLASLPPLPGFTTKLGILASFPPATLALAVIGLFLVGVGCSRALGRSEPPERSPSWVSVAAVVMTVAIGVFADPLFDVATRAAAALF